MKYNPHTGTVQGAIKGGGFTAAIKPTRNGAIITHLTITPNNTKRDISYLILQDINLDKIRETYRTWQKGNL